MDEVLDFICAKAEARRVNVAGIQNGIAIDTLEGTMIANPGDWIIRGVKGEFYPCKPDIFEQTYEPAALAVSPLEAQPLREALKRELHTAVALFIADYMADIAPLTGEEIEDRVWGRLRHALRGAGQPEGSDGNQG